MNQSELRLNTFSDKLASIVKLDGDEAVYYANSYTFVEAGKQKAGLTLERKFDSVAPVVVTEFDLEKTVEKAQELIKDVRIMNAQLFNPETVRFEAVKFKSVGEEGTHLVEYNAQLYKARILNDVDDARNVSVRLEEALINISDVKCISNGEAPGARIAKATVFGKEKTFLVQAYLTRSGEKKQAYFYIKEERS